MIIIPTYNERENIGYLVQKIRAAAGNIVILFVDDSSPDGTAEEIKILQQSDRNILLMVRPEKRGLGSAYIEAFEKVISENLSDYVITMDADLSHNPEVIPQLQKLLEKYDAVVGSRYTPGGNVKGWQRWRHYISNFGNKYARLLSSSPVQDQTAGFVAYRVEALKSVHLQSIRSNGYAFQMELKLRLHEAGKSFAEYPIHFTERREGKSKFSQAIFFEGLLFPIRYAFNKHRTHVLISAGVFALTLAAYALTAPHTLYLDDNSEFITAAATLGVTHPTGYPLYVLFAHIFSYVPLGGLVYRINLFSACTAALSLVFLYAIIHNALETLSFKRPLPGGISRLLAALGALLLGFSQIFWFESIVAKTYPLNFLFTVVIFWLVLQYWKSGKQSFAYWAGLLAGLGLANHQMLLLLLPVFAISFFLGPIKPKLGTVIQASVLFILGLSANLLMILFSLRHPVLDWGHVSSGFSAFLNHLLRRSYRDYTGTVHTQNAAAFFGDFLVFVWKQFSYFIIFAVVGFGMLLKKYKKFLFLTMGIFLCNTLGIILIRTLSFGVETSEVYKVYYLPAYGMVAVWVAVGVAAFAAWIFYKKIFSWMVVVAMALGVVVLATVNFPQNNLRTFHFLNDFSKSVVKDLPKNSVVLFSIEGPSVDSYGFSLLYQRAVEHVRPDITIVGYPEIFPSRFDSAANPAYALSITSYAAERQALVKQVMEDPELANRPLFSTFLVLSDPKGQPLVNVSNGLLYEVAASTTIPAIAKVAISEKDERTLSQSLSGRDLLAQYYYPQAALALDQKQYSRSQMLYVAAIQNAMYPVGDDSIMYRYYRSTLWPKEKTK